MVLIDDKSSYAPQNHNDGGIQQLWNMVLELSEQLSRNRARANTLYSLAANAKAQAVHSKTGFVLRRFNADIPKETYDAELEHMNDALSSENQALLHDNKHIGALIKEFEQTLETLMSTFRNRAREVQDRELSIVKEYETRLLALEEENSRQELEQDTNTSESISRLSHLLRQYMRLHNGEDPSEYTPQTIPTSLPSNTGPSSPRLTTREVEIESAEDLALDRECELARLQKENEELRRMVGLLPAKVRHPRLGSSGFNDRFGAYQRDSSVQRLSADSGQSSGY